MFNFAVKLEHDVATDSYVASCRDLPLFNAAGDTVEDALFDSIGGLIAAISIEMDARRPIPVPSEPESGEHVVNLPVLVVLKSALYNAMIETGTRKADLARKLGQGGAQVERLLDVEHSSKVETVELALMHLHRRVELSVRSSRVSQ